MAGELIPIADARERVLAAARPLEPERVPVADALDRVLSDDLVATGDVPPFPSSAMDGYAVDAGPAGRKLSVVGESRAGAPSTHGLGPGEAIRISTGAAVPAGATAVVPQEQVEVADGAVAVGAEVSRGGHIQVCADVTPGQHIRPAGEVMRTGTPVLATGTRLGPAELAAAIAAGAGQLWVARRPAVRVLCTGDELREPGSPLAPGEIHNSNGPMLVALAARCGAATTPAQQLPDDRASTESGLESALAAADVVIVSGGVSVGPHDQVKPALAELGVQERFWGVALQPGKPTWFGTREGKLVFGLPGNPVSAAVTFALFAAPALAALQGVTPPAAFQGAGERTLEGAAAQVAAPPLRSSAPSPTLQGAPVAALDIDEAPLATAVRRNPRREQAIRVRLEQRDGATVAVPNGPQGSHVISSLIGADALALIPRGEGLIDAGTPVALAPLPG